MDFGKIKVIVYYNDINIWFLIKELGGEYGDLKKMNEEWENYGNVKEMFFS